MLTRKILLVKSVSPIVDDTHLSWMNTKHGNKRLWIPAVGCRCFPKDLAFSFVIQEIAWTILLCNLFLSSLRVCASLSSSSFSLSHEVTKEKKNCEAAAVTVWEAFPTTELSPLCPLTMSLSATSTHFLNTFWDSNSTTSQGSLFQNNTTLS